MNVENIYLDYYRRMDEMQEAFSRLPRREREAAYAACRKCTGPSHAISVDELMGMHKLIKDLKRKD